MPFDINAFEPSVRDYHADWASLGLAWAVGPIHPNYGKALTSATFESVGLFAEISVWETGEAELESVRLTDGRIVNKHYDLASVAELDVILADLIALARDGAVPPDAVLAYVSDPRP
ncbi:MAG: hypothetical protein JWP40_1821 [Blastococcus sp.]|nr:hypothetical protein [Blastococcus sp.]